MQEGPSSLMQMAKVSVAVQALQSRGLPFVAVLSDPTYGGVSASYAMQVLANYLNIYFFKLL